MLQKHFLDEMLRMLRVGRAVNPLHQKPLVLFTVPEVFYENLALSISVCIVLIFTPLPHFHVKSLI